VHAPTLTGTAGIDFAGIWSRFPLPVREIAERYGVPRFDRFSELLDPIVGVRAYGDRPRVARPHARPSGGPIQLASMSAM
jgi:hypothetical protein